VRLLRKIIPIILAVILVACGEKTHPPRLVVLIVVDHFPQYAYEHYQPLFTGGLKWLSDHGVTFDNFHLEHGYASTGPGHFVLGSGQHPGPAGMLGNSFYDKRVGRDVYCIADSNAREIGLPSYPVSYENVPGSTFGDWLKAASPQSKVVGVGCKDRAAILLSGREADLAMWYNWRGSFTTNSYYTDTIPDWLHEFNTDNTILAYRDSIWTKSLPDSIYGLYAHADSFPGEDDRYMNEAYSPVFPIGFEPAWDDGRVYGEIGGRPWLDRLTLELAATATEALDLGSDDIPDVLTIGLSVMDIVAHYYGPFSHETMDLLVKMDGYLQSFIDDLDEQAGLENIVFAFTTDHGGLPLPEHWTGIMGRSGGRIDQEDLKAAREKAYAGIDELYGTHDFILRSWQSYFYDDAVMGSLGVDRAVVDSIIQVNLESVEGIARVYSKAELQTATHADVNALRLSRFIHPDLSPDLYTLVEAGWIYRGPTGTSHMTPYDYDSHIPLIFSSVDFEQSTRSDSVQMTDVATTLGHILGVEAPNPVDGLSLTPLQR